MPTREQLLLFTLIPVVGSDLSVLESELSRGESLGTKLEGHRAHLSAV